MEVHVRFFASLRARTGEPGCTLDVPDGATVEQALRAVVTRYPALAGGEGAWHFAVNQTHADSATVLRPGDVLAIFPYLAGG